jgi:hypothetical protein
MTWGEVAGIFKENWDVEGVFRKVCKSCGGFELITMQSLDLMLYIMQNPRE